MKRNALELILAHAQTLARAGMQQHADAELLQRFGTGDEAAFSELLHRHGPMVWATCRQTLPCQADAEDAFQATFLALVKSSKSIRQTQSIGAWLHGVAVRIVTQLKRSAIRRKQREQRSAESEAVQPIADSTWNAFHAEVHAEVERLPTKLRTVLVLCDLQGVSQSDAAKQLGWKPGTLTGRLCRARQTLIDRLARKGLVAASASGLLMLSATSAVPRELSRQVLSYATTSGAVVPQAISILVTEVTAMTVTKLKLLTATLLVAGGLTGAVGVGWVNDAEGQQPGGLGAPARIPPTPEPRASEEDKLEISWIAETMPAKIEYEFVDGVSNIPASKEMIRKMGEKGLQFVGQVTAKNGSMLVFMKPKTTQDRVEYKPVYGIPMKPEPPKAPKQPAQVEGFGEGGLGGSSDAGEFGPGMDGADGFGASGSEKAPQKAGRFTVIQLKHVDAESVASILTQAYGSELGTFTVIPDTRGNRLLIPNGLKIFDEMMNLIDVLDVDSAKPKQETLYDTPSGPPTAYVPRTYYQKVPLGANELPPVGESPTRIEPQSLPPTSSGGKKK